MLHIDFYYYRKVYPSDKHMLINLDHILDLLDITSISIVFNPKAKARGKAGNSHFHPYRTYKDKHMSEGPYHRP